MKRAGDGRGSSEVYDVSGTMVTNMVVTGIGETDCLEKERVESKMKPRFLDRVGRISCVVGKKENFRYLPRETNNEIFSF